MHRHNSPLPAGTVAAAFLAKAAGITTLKPYTIDLLCYTAHGYSLTIDGKRLLEQPVYATPKGIQLSPGRGPESRGSSEVRPLPLHPRQQGIIDNVWRNWREALISNQNILVRATTGSDTPYRQIRTMRRRRPLSQRIKPTRQPPPVIPDWLTAAYFRKRLVPTKTATGTSAPPSDHKAKRAGISDRELLGVSADADPAEIRTRYRQLMNAIHPDKAGPATEHLATLINQAYDNLADGKAG